jgi:hypothetical protein
MRKTLEVDIQGNYLIVYKYGKDDFSIWLTSNKDNINSGFSFRGKAEDIQAGFMSIFKLAREGFVRSRFEDTHPHITINNKVYNWLLDNGFEDVSYKNDECPSFQRLLSEVGGDEDMGPFIKLWLDHEQQEMRGLPWLKRYSLLIEEMILPGDIEKTDIVNTEFFEEVQIEFEKLTKKEAEKWQKRRSQSK